MNNNKKLLKSTILLGVGLSATSLILPILLNKEGVSKQEIILNNDSLKLGLERISDPSQSEMNRINSDVSTFNSDVNSLLSNSGNYGYNVNLKWSKTDSEIRKILPSTLGFEKPANYFKAEYLGGWGDVASTTKFSNFNNAKGTVDLEWNGSYQWITGTKYWFTKKGTIGGFGADMDGDGKIDSGKNTVLSKVEQTSINLSDTLVSELSVDPNNNYFIGKYIKTTSTDMPEVFSSSLEENKFNYEIVKEPAIGVAVVTVTPKYVYSTSGLKTNMAFGSSKYSKEIVISNIGINRSTKANIELLNTPESNEYFKHFTLEDIKTNKPVGAAPFDWRKIASYKVQTPYNQAVYSVNLTNFNVPNKTFDMQVIADKAFINGLLKENIMIGTLTIKVLNTSNKPEDLDGDGTLDEKKTTSINIIKNSSFDKKYQADQVTLEIAKSWLNITVINPWMIKVAGGFIEGPVNMEIVNADIQTGIVTVKVWVEHSFKMVLIDGEEVCVDGGELIQMYEITGLTIPPIVPEKDLDGDGVPDVAKQTELIVTQTLQPNLSLMASEVTLDNIKNWFSIEIKDSWKVLSPNGVFINTPVSTTIVSSENKKGEVVIKFEIFKSFKKIIIPGNPPIESCIEGGPIEITKTITGFKILKPTVVSSGEYNLDNQVNNSSELFTVNDIKSYVFNNLITGGKPENFNINNILVSNIERYNGRIIFNIQLNNFVDLNNNVVTTGFNWVKVTLTGFKILNPTIIESTTYQVLGYENKPATSENFDIAAIKNFVSEPFNAVIKGDLPEKWNTNMILISSATYKNGEITAVVRLTKCIDVEGKESNNFIPVEITLKGFKRIKPTFLITQSGPITIEKQQTVVATSVNNFGIKDYIFSYNNLNPNIIIGGDFVPKFGANDIQINKDAVYNNLKGNISVEITLLRWYDENGEEQYSKPGFSLNPIKVELTGFKKIKPTKIKTTGEYDDETNEKIKPINVSEIMDLTNRHANSFTIEDIKVLIIQNRSEIISGDVVQDFNKFDIIINENNVKYNNKNGSIVVKISLKKWYDRNGFPLEFNGDLECSGTIMLMGFFIPKDNTILYASIGGGGGGLLLLILIALLAIYASNRKRALDQYDEYNDEENYSEFENEEDNQYLLEDQNGNEENYLEFKNEADQYDEYNDEEYNDEEYNDEEYNDEENYSEFENEEEETKILE